MVKEMREVQTEYVNCSKTNIDGVMVARCQAKTTVACVPIEGLLIAPKEFWNLGNINSWSYFNRNSGIQTQGQELSQLNSHLIISDLSDLVTALSVRHNG